MRVAEEPKKLGDEFFQDPHAATALLRSEGPARPVIMPRGLRAWLVTGYADARALLADPRLSKDSSRAYALFAAQISATGVANASSPSLAAHMLNSDPPDHTRLRKLVNKAFTVRTVSRLRPRIERITDDLLDELATAAEADLMARFASPLPITVICELLGVPGADRDRFAGWSHTLVSAAPAEQIHEAAGFMTGYLMTLIEAKREAPTADLLSDLVHTFDDSDQLSGNELVAMAFLLLVAGHETTVNLIGNGVLALLRHPAQLAALRRDPSLMPNAVEEILRYEGPVNLATLRFTTEPLQIGEVEIPEGEFVMVSLLGANRDDDRFAEADRLDITRAAGSHLAFGHGIHYCVGAPLARLEAEVAIGRLLARFGELELAAEPGELGWRDSTLVHGLESLPIRLRT
jgi:cytochrome P450